MGIEHEIGINEVREQVCQQRKPFHDACRDLREVVNTMESLARACGLVGLSEMADNLWYFARELDRLNKAFTDYDGAQVIRRLAETEQAAANMLSAALAETERMHGVGFRRGGDAKMEIK